MKFQKLMIAVTALILGFAGLAHAQDTVKKDPKHKTKVHGKKNQKKALKQKSKKSKKTAKTKAKPKKAAPVSAKTRADLEAARKEAAARRENPPPQMPTSAVVPVNGAPADIQSPPPPDNFGGENPGMDENLKNVEAPAENE